MRLKLKLIEPTGIFIIKSDQLKGDPAMKVLIIIIGDYKIKDKF